MRHSSLSPDTRLRNHLEPSRSFKNAKKIIKITESADVKITPSYIP